MLPEFPLTFVFHLVYIIMGYPIWIVVETGVREILLFKSVVGVKDGFGVIAVLDNVQPSKDASLELFHINILGNALNIQNWRQVAL